MKKILNGILLAVLLIIFLYSCSNISTAPSIIPPDPIGTTKPSIATYSEGEIYGSIDLNPSLLPIAVSEYVKFRISLPDISEISAANLRVFEDNKEQGVMLYKESSIAKKIDIAVILDVTGSMENAINGLKNSIIDFANTLSESGMDVRIAIIPFGDYVNPPSDTIPELDPPYLNLTTPANAKEYVEYKLDASGGGDGPENPYDAIYVAAKELTWRSDAQKFMILITDAPAHYPDDYSDYAHYSKNDLKPLLKGYFTLHSVIVPSWWYSPDTSDFSSPDDVRELSTTTGGLILYTDNSGNVDLTALGIIEYIESSWIVAFESNSSAEEHTIEAFFEKGEIKRYLKLENVEY